MGHLPSDPAHGNSGPGGPLPRVEAVCATCDGEIVLRQRDNRLSSQRVWVWQHVDPADVDRPQRHTAFPAGAS